jgi:hypothetical protein
MTANVVRVNSNYKIQSVGGGQIILDTGLSSSDEYGKVLILGDLDVRGASTSLTTNIVDIQDVVLTLNSGEIGPGVTGTIADPGISGLQIDRGPVVPGGNTGYAHWVWDENQQWVNPKTDETVFGLWVSKTETGGLNGIQTNSITVGDTNSSIYLIGAGQGILSVTGTDNYEEQVLDYAAQLAYKDPDIIPNIKAVEDKINYNLNNVAINQITRGGDSTISIFDSNVTEKITTYSTVGFSTVVKINHFPISNKSLDIDTSKSVTIIGNDSPAMNGTFQVITATPGAFFFSIQLPALHNYPDLPWTGNISIANYRSNASVSLNSNLISTFYDNQVILMNLSITRDTVQPDPTDPKYGCILSTRTDTDLTIKTSGTGLVIVDKELKINNITNFVNQSKPNSVAGITKIYAAAHGVGNTGLYFVNTDHSGEFISKKKAIAFSILM